MALLNIVSKRRPILAQKKAVSENQTISYLFIATLELVYLLFSLYRLAGSIYHRVQLKWFSLTYNQNRSPKLIQQDVANFKKIPSGVGAVLKFKNANQEGGGVDGLLEQISNLSTWCVGAEIDSLVLYERSGVLKTIPVSDIEARITRKLEKFYAPANFPTFKINFPYSAEEYVDNSTFVGEKQPGNKEKVTLNITILSIADGRQSVVNVSRSLAQLVSENKMSTNDITVTALDREFKTLVCKEPDLVYVFSPSLDLDGFPPWHIRLSEIFYMKDNSEVSYAVFLKGLEKYSGVKINVGR